MFVRGPMLFLIISSVAACDYQPADNGQPQRVAQDRSGNVYTFGDVEQVRGTRFFTVPILRVEGSTDSGTFSKTYRGSEEHNRLIVDASTGQSRRVLPDTRFEIVSWVEPSLDATNLDDPRKLTDEGSKSSGLYAAVVKRPGKTDKQPSTYDLLLGHFDSGRQAWISRGLSGVQAIWLNPGGKLVVIAAIRNRGVYQLYDPTTDRQLLQTELKVQ